MKPSVGACADACHGEAVWGGSVCEQHLKEEKKNTTQTARVFRFSVYTVQFFSLLCFVVELRVTFSIKCVPCV